MNKPCLVCGAFVPMMLMRSRDTSGCTSLGGGWRIRLARPEEVCALCDEHFRIWIESMLAQRMIKQAHGSEGVGLSRYGFKLVAHKVGMSPKRLKKCIVRTQDMALARDRRERNGHDYVSKIVARKFYKQNPWAAAALGIGSLSLIGAIAGYYLSKKAA